MGLFVVRHQHDPARCPATDPLRGAGLLNYLSRPHVRRQGIEIKGEAVVSGEHTMFMIIEADDAELVRQFMAPFAEAGSVDVFPASTCAGVVASGGCAAPPPELGTVEAMDPETACQDAIDAGLLVHRAHPLNGETSLDALIGGVVMPSARFYVRNHFQIPVLDPAAWRLEVRGLVDRPLRLSLRELQQMRSETQVVTLECAGNGRSLLDPPVEGEQWQLGAVSTAEWTGVPLVEVLDRCGVRGDAVEVLFRGADSGAIAGRANDISFERSLPVADARSSGVLLAYAMNGAPLPREHGYPLRVIVPSWYAVGSVKWLTEIEVLGERFDGYFQADRYVYEWERNGSVEREPVSLQQVRSLVTEPKAGDTLTPGPVLVRGVAWSGAAAIARVDVSVGDGPWHEARLIGDRHRHSWQWWEASVEVDGNGPSSIRSRAADLAGRVQPERAVWNRLGYGSNAIACTSVDVLRS
jgi:DMSO/TMAO reductase YedYZ molybdopterin-dependent catalytic subunit